MVSSKYETELQDDWCPRNSQRWAAKTNPWWPTIHTSSLPAACQPLLQPEQSEASQLFPVECVHWKCCAVLCNCFSVYHSFLVLSKCATDKQFLTQVRKGVQHPSGFWNRIHTKEEGHKKQVSLTQLLDFCECWKQMQIKRSLSGEWTAIMIENIARHYQVSRQP